MKFQNDIDLGNPGLRGSIPLGMADIRKQLVDLSSDSRTLYDHTMRTRGSIFSIQDPDRCQPFGRFSGTRSAGFRRPGAGDRRARITVQQCCFCRAKPWIWLQTGENRVSGSKSAFHWFSRTCGCRRGQEAVFGLATQFSGFLLEGVSC